MKKEDILKMRDAEIVFSTLPDGWQEKAEELGALQRKRVIDSAESLFRILMLHLGEGLSLRSCATRVEESGLASISDVGILYRLRNAWGWLEWMTRGIVRQWSAEDTDLPAGMKVKYVDSSDVRERGKTGSLWRIHYAIEKNSLRCCDVELSDMHTTDSFEHYSISENDLLVADRGFCKHSGINYVRHRGAHVLVRVNPKGVRLCDPNGNRFELLTHLRAVARGEVGEWRISIQSGEELIHGRLCAVKKDANAAKKAKQQARTHAKKHQYRVSGEALELAEYTLIFTTVPDSVLSASKVMEVYRGRWQVELVFKRLKSLVELSYLPKQDPDTIFAWLQGKLLVATLVEYLLGIAENFFPWGYPLPEDKRSRKMPVAGI